MSVHHTISMPPNTTMMMRAPRAKPDLRLAESYIPAAVTCVKGVLYTAAVCFLSRLKTPFALVPPLVVLYYDHLLWWSPTAFMDSTSVCTDIVAGTILMTMQNAGGGSREIWAGLMAWSLLAAGHIYVGKEGARHLFAGNNNHNQAVMLLVHVVPILCLSVLLISHSSAAPRPDALFYYQNNNNNATQDEQPPPAPQWPFYCRSAVFLLLVIVDTYTLRPPTQRERDRVCMLRYGAVLFAPVVAPLGICAALLGGAQIARHYYGGHDAVCEAPPTSPRAPRRPMHYTPAATASILSVANTAHNNTEPAFMTATHSSSSVDSLDVHEAFRLAKLQYMSN